MRGETAFYQSLFESTPAKVADQETKKRGRDEDLFNKQTQFLILRYYYYIKIQQVPYRNSMEYLENELFISQRTIVNRLFRAHSQFQEIFHKMKPTLKQLKEIYPHINW